MATSVPKMEQFEVKLIKQGVEGLGFSITGRHPGTTLNSAAPDADHSEPLSIFVQHLAPGGLADTEGTLRAGDQLLVVNGVSLLGVAYMEATNQLRNTRGLTTLLVAREVSQESPALITTAAVDEPPSGWTKSRSSSESTASLHSFNDPDLEPARPDPTSLPSPPATILEQPSSSSQLENLMVAPLDDRTLSSVSSQPPAPSVDASANHQSFNASLVIESARRRSSSSSSSSSSPSNDNGPSNSKQDKSLASNLSAENTENIPVVLPSVNENFDRSPVTRSKYENIHTSEEVKKEFKERKQDIKEMNEVNEDQVFTRGIPVAENRRRNSISSSGSSSSDAEADKIGWLNGNELKEGDDENAQALKLKYELAQLQSKELEEKLATTLSEIETKERTANGPQEKLPVGIEWNMETMERKLKEAELTAEKTLNEITNYQTQLEKSRADFVLYERQMAIELNTLSIKHSNTKVLLEQCRSRDDEYTNQKSVMIQRHLDKEKEYVHTIHQLKQEIEKLNQNAPGEKRESLKIQLPAASYSPEFYKPPSRGLQSPLAVQSPPAFPTTSSGSDLSPSSPVLHTVIGRGFKNSNLDPQNATNNNSSVLRSSNPLNSEPAQKSSGGQISDAKVRRSSSSSSSSSSSLSSEKDGRLANSRGPALGITVIKKSANEEEGAPSYAPPPVPENELKMELKNEGIHSQAAVGSATAGFPLNSASESTTVREVQITRPDRTDSNRSQPDEASRRRSHSSISSTEEAVNLRRLKTITSEPYGAYEELSGRADIGDLETRSLDDLDSVHRMNEDIGKQNKNKKKTTSFGNIRKLFSSSKSKGIYDPSEASAAHDRKVSQSEAIPVEAGPKKSVKHRFFGRFGAGKSKNNELPVSDAKMENNLSSSSPNLVRASRNSEEGQIEAEIEIRSKKKNKLFGSNRSLKKKEAKKKQKEKRGSISSSDSNRSLDDRRKHTTTEAASAAGLASIAPSVMVTTSQKPDVKAESSASASLPNFGSPSFALSGGVKYPSRVSDNQNQGQNKEQIIVESQGHTIQGKVQGQGHTGSQGQNISQSGIVGGKTPVDDERNYSSIADTEVHVERQVEYTKEISVKEVDRTKPIGHDPEAMYYNKNIISSSPAAGNSINVAVVGSSISAGAKSATPGQSYSSQSTNGMEENYVNQATNRMEENYVNQATNRMEENYVNQATNRMEENYVNQATSRNEKSYQNQQEMTTDNRIVVTTSRSIEGEISDISQGQESSRVLQERQESVMSYLSGNVGPDVSLVEQWGVGEVCQWAEQAGLEFCQQSIIEKQIIGERLLKANPQAIAKELQLSGEEQHNCKVKVKELQSEFSKIKKLREKDRKQAEKIQKGQKKLLNRSSKKQQKQQQQMVQQDPIGQNEQYLEHYEQGMNEHGQGSQQNGQGVEQNNQHSLERPSMRDVRGEGEIET